MSTSVPKFCWRKLGLVFDASSVGGRVWLRHFAQAPASLLSEDSLRIYFSCRPSADADGRYVSYSAWADFDRTDPTKLLRVSERPVLELGGLGEFDEFGTYPFSVVRNGPEVRAYYGGWTRCESVPFNVAIGVATSNDGGGTFSRVGCGPVIPYSPDEPFVMSGPKVRRFDGAWYLWYIAGSRWKVFNGRAEPVYRIRMARSDDGFLWSKLNKDLIESRLEEDEAQASPDVFYSGGVYHMFFCYRYSTDYRGKARGYRIGYAWSRDLTSWRRDDARAGMDVSEEGWDSEMVSYPHVFETGGRIYMAYLGNDVGKAGFGLAVLEGELR